MKLPRRRFLHLAAGAVALPALSRIARAQAYPTRTITAIVPASAGGPTDTIGRIVTQHMQATLGQSVVIENVGGASGTIGTTRVVRATPDGYTIGIGGVNHYVVNGAVYPLQYDLLKDFEPISMIATGPQLILSRNSIPATNLKELLAWLKVRPDSVTYATGGVASPPHVSGLAFQNVTGTKFQFVPFRGTAPAIQSMIGGHVDIIFDQASSTLSMVKSGSIRAYAVTAKARLASAPDIPTVDEAGLPGFHVSIWQGIWAPKGTPKEIVARLNAAVVSALADSQVQKRLQEIGQELPSREQQTTAGFGAFHKAEVEKWWPIIKAAGLKIE
jgi:tripartite-type tricarboxylate transporter receptor subunit TctC